MGEVQERIALVTGAAGGIGQAIVRRLAAEGAHVIAADREVKNLEELVQSAGAIQTQQTDVTDLEGIQAMFAAVREQHGRLDILVNNAGVPSRTDFRHLSDEDWAGVIDVNLQGTVRCMREGLDVLKESEQAAIVNLGSIMDTRHVRQLSAYAASKGAIAALTRSVAVEYAAFGIRVNSISPGYVETAMTRTILRNPALREALLERTPLKRFPTPDDIADATLFLASVRANSITGQSLVVDGGTSVAL